MNTKKCGILQIFKNMKQKWDKVTIENITIVEKYKYLCVTLYDRLNLINHLKEMK